ncbi:dolichol monophosphate mannose synthase [Polymorphobacter glacialis]|uniref:Dolichol monophosphate mannose synthase n=2 Tax=Sandarakinorhabdus glacialis TaxID=1614636 RepID=A0A916ZT00_9SPHN|nr:dolichol monophosphate mannose synthase [Polymorphobacter glacialis]
MLGAPMLVVIVPTFNEAANIARLTALLEAALVGVAFEVIFVDDDSSDGTIDVVRGIAAHDPRVRGIQRIGRRGLASACIEGALASAAPFIAVIDGDLQHDETLLPVMLAKLQGGDLDIVVGSRYVSGGGTGDWQAERASMSRLATRLSRSVMSAALNDPMSGFFMIRRDAFMAAVRNLSALGFKLLLDLFVSSPVPLRFAELPYQFRSREAGESKLDSGAMWDFAILLLDKAVGGWVPVRFLSFSLIGGLGVFLHMFVLALALKGFGLPFGWSQGIATMTAMTVNFWLNNKLTYRDRRLKGWGIATGLLSFYAACSVGVAANVGVAGFIAAHQYRWWVAGVAGVLISAVWNYAATSLITWRR